MKFTYKKTLLSLAIIGALGLTGCSSSSSSSSDSDVGSDVTTSGAVAKGILYLGDVNATELDSSAQSVGELGSTQTEIDGSYSLPIAGTYAGGPIQMLMTSSVATQMKCDVAAGCGTRSDDIDDTDSNIDFGEWYKPGDGAIHMQALLGAAASGSSVNVNITPFTNMAAERALEAGTLNEDAVDNANSEVSNLLGINILETAPVDITDDLSEASSDQIAYAALSAAIASLVPANEDGTPDLDGALDLLADSFSGGQILADDGDATTTISLQDILDGAQAVLDEAEVSDTSGIFAALQVVIDETPEGGYIDPEPGDTATFSEVDIVKALMADLRTWIYATEAELADPELDSEVQAQIDLAQAAVESLEDADSPVAALEQAIVDALMIALDDPDYDGWIIPSAVSVDGDIVTVSDALVMGYTVNMVIDLPEEGVEYSTLLIGVTSAAVENSMSSLMVDAATVNLDLSEAYVMPTYEQIQTAEGEGILPDITGGSIATDVTLEQGTVSVTGAMSTNVTKVTGEGGGEGDGSNNAIYIPTSITLDGIVSANETYDLEATWAVTLTNANEVTGLKKIIEGEVEETDTNYVDFVTGVTFDTSITDLPEATINVTLERTGLDTSDLTTTINYDDRRLMIETAVDGMDENSTLDNTVTVTNQDGAVLVMSIVEPEVEGGSITGTLSFNDVVYGNLTEDDNGIKITYTDGTFEYY